MALTKDGHERLVVTTEHDLVIHQVVRRGEPMEGFGIVEAPWVERQIYGDDEVKDESTFVQEHVKLARKHAKAKTKRPQEDNGGELA